MEEQDFQDRLINELKNIGINQKKWHSDKGVPIAVMLMFAGQLMWAAWYGSSIASGVDENSEDIESIRSNQLTLRDKELFERMIKSNHELALEIRGEVKDLREEMRSQIKSGYRLEKKIDVFIEGQKSERRYSK